MRSNPAVSRDPDLDLERAFFAEGMPTVGGIDEVGRGAWAGPIVVGVVVLDHRVTAFPPGVRDSKLLTARAREARAAEIRPWCAAWSLGIAPAAEIDEQGLSEALRRATTRALDGLGAQPSALLVDGAFDFVGSTDVDVAEPHVPRPKVRTVVHGDRRSASIAAASILAKVARDELMTSMAEKVPGYGFEVHKGYGTRAHQQALMKLGVSPQHRRTWQFPRRADRKGRGSPRPVRA